MIMAPYLPQTKDDQLAMLETIGIHSIDQTL